MQSKLKFNWDDFILRFNLKQVIRVPTPNRKDKNISKWPDSKLDENFIFSSNTNVRQTKNEHTDEEHLLRNWIKRIENKLSAQISCFIYIYIYIYIKTHMHTHTHTHTSGVFLQVHVNRLNNKCWTIIRKIVVVRKIPECYFLIKFCRLKK